MAVDEMATSMLRQWRQNRGWTLADLSGLTGYDISYLSLIERGLREPPPAAKVLIARRIGASVAEVFPSAREEVGA